MNFIPSDYFTLSGLGMGAVWIKTRYRYCIMKYTESQQRPEAGTVPVSPWPVSQLGAASWSGTPTAGDNINYNCVQSMSTILQTAGHCIATDIFTISTSNFKRYSLCCFIYYLFSFVLMFYYYRVDQKKGWSQKHGYNYLEIHQKGIKLVCFGKFSLNVAG